MAQVCLSSNLVKEIIKTVIWLVHILLLTSNKGLLSYFLLYSSYYLHPTSYSIIPSRDYQKLSTYGSKFNNNLLYIFLCSKVLIGRFSITCLSISANLSVIHHPIPTIVSNKKEYLQWTTKWIEGERVPFLACCWLAGWVLLGVVLGILC